MNCKRVMIVCSVSQYNKRPRLALEMLKFRAMLTVFLLLISNTFMTFAWYGHLKHKSAPIVEAVLLSWLIALGEYCFQVPANRIGYGRFTGYQLKIIQECVTLVVFAAFAYFYLGEPVRWNYAVSFLFIIGAVVFAFWGRF
jgi:uncharacterized protein